MQNSTNMRILELLRYLYERTDENHPSTVSDIIAHLNGKDVPSQSLETELVSLRKIDEKQAVQVRADQEVEVGKLVAIIDAIRNAGFQHFDLMTQQVNRK